MFKSKCLMASLLLCRQYSRSDALLADLQLSTNKNPAIISPKVSSPSNISSPTKQAYTVTSPTQFVATSQSERQHSQKMAGHYMFDDFENPGIYETQLPAHPVNVHHQQQHNIVERRALQNAVPSTRQVSTLSTNLSELDSLLQELSSAQFSVEVDRRSGAGIPSGGRSAASGGLERDFIPMNEPVQHSAKLTGASSATSELDDLMLSLSGMTTMVGSQDSRTVNVAKDPTPMKEPVYSTPDKTKMPMQGNSYGEQPSSGYPNQRLGSSSYSEQEQAPRSSAPPVGQSVNLNAMLEDLDKNMTMQGVTIVPKGFCAACAKPIVGQSITAMARLWHPEHFCCVHCKEAIGTRNFFERDGAPYCEHDYHFLFSPRCAQCSGPILDKCVTALDKTWHPEHFVCAQCGRELGDESFHERDGMVFCRDDYFYQFAPKCGGCRHPIVENFISALNQQWHPQCFVCYECRVPFGSASFFDHEGLPYCETHFHQKRGSLCAHCGQPVTGRCITAMYKKFHPEHFVCTYCQKPLNKGTFKEEKDKPYCHPCFVKLFS